MLMNIQAPLAKTTILELSSKGDQFEIWSPRDNKLYIGRNSAREFDLEDKEKGPGFTARPKHILEAILPTAIELQQPGDRIMRTEEQDANAKYYVLTLVRETDGQEVRALRRQWIERSRMVIVKEETFTDEGQIDGIVSYDDFSEFDGVTLPLSIHIDRPLDGYRLDIQIGNWRVNPDLPEDAFTLKPPPAAERIILKEKARSSHS